MIEIKNVAKWYGGVVALSGLTANIGRGLTSLLGPNGAGKSSLIRIMCGLTSPSQGSVRVLGKDPRSSGEIRKAIGLVPQQSVTTTVVGQMPTTASPIESRKSGDE